MADSLLFESAGGVVRLTLNRPEKRNALSFELLGASRARDHGIDRSRGPSGRARLARAGLLLGARPGGDGRAEPKRRIASCSPFARGSCWDCGGCRSR